MLSVEPLRSIAVKKLVSESGGGLGVASELLIVCFDGVRRAGEVSPVFGRFALGDMTVNQTVCFAEHVQCVQSRMVTVRMAQIIVANGSKSYKDVSAH